MALKHYYYYIIFIIVGISHMVAGVFVMSRLESRPIA